MPISLDVPTIVNIGPWLKFTPELFKALQAENAAMAGMTFAEAALSMGYKFVSGVGWVKNISITTEAVAAGTSAVEAIGGAVATGAAETTTGTIVLTETASGGAAAMGLGTIATGAAAIALAGAAGFIIGNVIGDIIDYNFPEFFDGLFCSISEFLTGDERGLAFLFDSDGHSYLPEVTKEAIATYLQKQESIKDECDKIMYNNFEIFVKTLEIGDVVHSGGNYYYKATQINSESPVYAYCLENSDSINIPLSFFSKTHFTIPVIKYEYNSNGEFVAGSEASFNAVVNSSTKPSYYGLQTKARNPKHDSYGSTAYFDVPISHLGARAPEDVDLTSSQLLDKLNRMFLFGTDGDTNTSGSTNPPIQKYEVPAKPKIKVHTQPKSDDDTESEPETWIRIPLPEPSDDPEALPKTTPILEPEDKPETEKLPKPLPQPEPQGSATPSPEVDPSTDIDIVTPTPIPTPPPSDTGSTGEPPLPVIPPLSSSATGLLHVYNPTVEQVNAFGVWLWTTFSGDIIDTISKLFNNPMEAVIGLHELYCTPITGEPDTIKAGFLDSEVPSRLVIQRYTEINCGAITVPEYWGNYLDYAPYTKVYCYLPFIGIVELNTDDIIGHGVQVVYKIDTYNGSCIAMIITSKNRNQECVKYQFSGNCAVEVPITSGMKSAMQSALIGAATCAIGAATAGVGGGMLAGMSAVSGVKNGLNSKNSVSHSGSFGSSYGAMGIKKPYFIVRRPIQKVVKNYNKKYGYPAHSMVTIGNCSGYLRCRDFDVQSSTATEEEKKRIEILLKEGVYV